jgi:hypothetical protein
MVLGHSWGTPALAGRDATSEVFWHPFEYCHFVLFCIFRSESLPLNSLILHNRIKSSEAMRRLCGLCEPVTYNWMTPNYLGLSHLLHWLKINLNEDLSFFLMQFWYAEGRVDNKISECAAFQEYCIRREVKKELPTVLPYWVRCGRYLATWNIMKPKFR